MKTAEEILKSKLDGKITFVNNPDYTFNKVIEAMEEYRLQSHPSPMSAEQYDLQKLYDWVMDENRKPSITAFTSSIARNIAFEFEFRLSKHKSAMSAEQVEEQFKFLLYFLKEVDLDLFNNQQEFHKKVVFKHWLKLFHATTPSVKADGWVSVEDVERLQSEIHKITGDGEVMMLFNKLLGVSAK